MAAGQLCIAGAFHPLSAPEKGVGRRSKASIRMKGYAADESLKAGMMLQWLCSSQRRLCESRRRKTCGRYARPAAGQDCLLASLGLFYAETAPRGPRADTGGCASPANSGTVPLPCAATVKEALGSPNRIPIAGARFFLAISLSISSYLIDPLTIAHMARSIK